jgi:F0F1-type ATP synthase alpha subunit
MGNGYFDDVPVDDVKTAERDMVEYVRNHPSGVLQTLANRPELSEEVVKNLNTALKAFKAQYKATA